MQVNNTTLLGQLKKGLSPLLFIYGDEPLLIEDAHQLCLRAYRAQAFEERIVLHYETSFDWSVLRQHLESMSLFAHKKIIELRMPNGKPGTKGAQILTDYCANPSADICLMIISQKIDASIKRSAWVKAFDSNGLLIDAGKVYPNQLPNWVLARAKNYQLTLDSDAVQTLSYFLEGNLLSIDQTLKQLSLLYNDEVVTGEAVAAIVSDSSRYNTFSLADSCLQGDSKSALHILQSLIREKAEPVLINWALQKEIRLLLQLAINSAQKMSAAQSYKELNIWQARQSLVQRASQRLSLSRLNMLHARCQELDQFIKGANDDYAGNNNREAQLWHQFEKLVVLFSR